MDTSCAFLPSNSRLWLLPSIHASPRLLVGTTVSRRRFSPASFLQLHSFAIAHPSPAFPAARLAVVSHNPRLFSNVDALRASFFVHGRIPSNFQCKGSLMEESTIEDKDIDTSGGQGPPPDNGEGGGGGGGAMGRASSALIFAIWASCLVYCFLYSPNQTPSLDQYFLERLLFLKADEGYEMNRVLVCLWNVMGIWPAIYAMLLIPSGRSSKGVVPVWPFTILSFFAGAFALLPYFGLWRPPPPAVSKEEIDGWPLKILDSKILSVVLAVAGASLIGVALFSGDESWKEFLQYFNSSRFIHIMSLDFLALSTLAPFWIYNDMEIRKWSNRDYWTNALTFIPFLGPSLYLIFRPSLVPDAFKDKALK